MVNEAMHSENAVIDSLLSTLIRLQSHLRLYTGNNATIDQASSKLFYLLDQLFEKTDPITLHVARHGFIYGDAFIDRSNKGFEACADRFFQHGIASLVLHKGVMPHEIISFLELANRKPSETWDEGGIENCLRLRNIKLLKVREMVEQDFRMDGEADNTEIGSHNINSSLWERLAMSIVHEQHFTDVDGCLMQNVPPSELAELANKKFREGGEEAGVAHARELSRFLISLKHEKIRIYRHNAVKLLTEYINKLSPEIRDLFLTNAFNLNLDADLSEGFLTGLSDQIILDALQNASMENGYTPPVIMKLLGRLAKERGIIDKTVQTDVSGGQENASKLKTLFKSDDFDSYVPKQYQDALLNIIKSDRLPNRISEHLENLKATLEPSTLEDHVGEILLEVLRGSDEQINVGAIRGSLITSMDDFISSRNYVKLTELSRLCSKSRIGEDAYSEMAKYFSSQTFISSVLNDLKSVDKEKAEEIFELILALGSFFVDPLLDRLGEETNRPARRTFLTALSRIGEQSKKKAIARLSDSRWFVTRNMIYLLSEFNDPAMLPHIRRYLGHSHPKVQHDALKTCLMFRDVKAIPVLLKALEASEETALISAINLAGISGDSQVHSRLISLLKGGSLLNYRLEVRKAAARALALANLHLALQEFQKILASSNLFHTHQHENLKIEIIAILDSFPSEVVRHLLQDQAQNGTAEVALAAQAALTKIAEARKHE